VPLPACARSRAAAPRGPTGRPRRRARRSSSRARARGGASASRTRPASGLRCGRPSRARTPSAGVEIASACSIDAPGECARSTRMPLALHAATSRLPISLRPPCCGGRVW
jgi:hypothetical protein